MKAIPIETGNPQVHLIQPEIERDAPLGVRWLDGELGRNTLRNMGVADANNIPSSLEDERERVRGFIDRPDQLNWMIAYDGQVIGAIWADLMPTDELPSPAVHIMIGDPGARGKGVGSASVKAVVDYLRQTGAGAIYSRHVVDNANASHMLGQIGFINSGEPYISDVDGLNWQNMSLAEISN